MEIRDYMHGGDVIAQVLKKKGIKFLFTLCGGHISPILVGAKNQGIRVIDVRHEATAVFAADAISRLTGVPGVAAVTAGPGVTNSVTAIKNAQMAQSPLILLGGSAATVLKGRGALQDIEQVKLYKTVSKWAVSIERDCDIVPILEEAFDVSQSGIPGPVFIECPIDILYEEELVRKWYGAKSGVTESKNLGDKVVNWYLKKHVDKLFSCSSESLPASKQEQNISNSIDHQKKEEIMEFIKSAKTPVMILGSQALLNVNEARTLSEAVNNLGIPVYLTGMARGLLGDNNTLNFIHKRQLALKEADLVILAGVPCDFRLEYGRSINRKAVLISINRSKRELKRNRKPTLGLQADPSVFLRDLAFDLPILTKRWEEWKKKLQTREDDREKEIQSFCENKTEYINPLSLCKQINSVLDKNSLIVVDGGDFVASASYIVRPKTWLRWLDAGPYGTLGAGAGFALAAKLVDPNKDVWILYGDGAAGYNLIEFDTFMRHNIPVIAVIGNDAGWTQISRDQIEYLKDDVGTVLNYSNYHTIAESFGAKGFLVDKIENVRELFLTAKDLVRNGHPVLINALIGKTDFRKGAISM